MSIYSNDLKNIEDFNSAYSDRLADFIKLPDDRAIIKMHLGGIIIECFLKRVLVRKFKIIKTYKTSKIWYDQIKFDEIDSTSYYVGKIYNHKKTIDNPGHKLSEALALLNEMDSVMPRDVLDAFKAVENPYNLANGHSSYIDLRYEVNTKFSERDYNDWVENFKKCLNWLIKNEKLI